MLARPAALAAALLLVLAGVTGCRTLNAGSASPSPSPAHHAAPSTTPSSAPAAAALSGGACLLLDYQEINSAIGTDFDVAAAATSKGTYLCEVQAGDATYPQLTLAITATTLTTDDFTSSVKPSGAKSVSSLGKIGYSVPIKATSSAGAGVEIGWLSGNDRLIVLRYVGAAGSTVPSTLSAGLVTLARKVDATTV
ncbi:MAG TPA: hypothetical protein VGJ28_26585 [Micromonosporaceae bacterium]